MVQVNFARSEVQCKVVYYGPAQAGKTANLRAIHARSPAHVRGALTTISTDADRTLFFDFLPLNIGRVAGVGTKIHVYAVPYLDAQNAVRVLVLEGVDGIVFVASSSGADLEENARALANLRENLATFGRALEDVPMVVQFNKADAPDALPLEELREALGVQDWFSSTAVATNGTGVFTTLKAITQRVLENVTAMMAMQIAPLPEPEEEPAPVDAKGLPAGLEIPAPAEPATGLPPGDFEDVALPPEPEPEPEPEPITATSGIPPWRHAPPDGYRKKWHAAPPEEPPPPVEEQVPEPAPPSVEEAPPEPPAPAVEQERQPVPEAAPEEPEQEWLDVDTFGSDTDTRAVRARLDTWGAAPRPQPPRKHRAKGRGRHTVEPVIERRKAPRAVDKSHVIPAAHMAAGALITMFSLATIGYLVHALL